MLYPVAVLHDMRFSCCVVHLLYCTMSIHMCGSALSSLLLMLLEWFLIMSFINLHGFFPPVCICVHKVDAEYADFISLMIQSLCISSSPSAFPGLQGTSAKFSFSCARTGLVLWIWFWSRTRKGIMGRIYNFFLFSISQYKSYYMKQKWLERLNTCPLFLAFRRHASVGGLLWGAQTAEEHLLSFFPIWRQ